MRKPIRIALLAGTAGVIVAGGTAAAIAIPGDSQPVKTATTGYNGPATAAPKAAGTVTAAQARHTAQQRVPAATVTETDLDHEHGKAVWEVDLTGQHARWEVHVDAATGKITGVSASKASASDASQPAPVKAAGTVTAAQARHAAQQRLPAATVTETDLDHEHGKAVWEVDLTGQHAKWEVHADAVTGNILSIHHDTDTGGHD
jgi:uncharacterized membrane protein YkoI